MDREQPKTGVMICGHGSRSQSAVDEFAVLAQKLPTYFPDEWCVEYGYLEFANPVIRVGLDKLRSSGCTRILAVPGMLFAAMHAKNDIPSVLNSYAEEHGIEVKFGRELGIDPKMIMAAGERIKSAVESANAHYGTLPIEETCLVVIGRGASDPDANSNVAKIARMLHEGLGFGWCEVGYSGVTFPLVEPCLRNVVKLGFKRVIVFPYFLFTGILIDRIYGFTDKVAAEHPEIEFVKAGYLKDHTSVLETFAERVKEQLGEQPIPNCGICHYRSQILSLKNETRQITLEERRAILKKGKGHPAFGDVPPPTCVLCKYRTAVLGFETEIGSVQESHHHHVEGQGAFAAGSNVTSCQLCTTFCTGECRLYIIDHHHDHHHHGHDHHHHHHHHHDHHHPVYPHAKHPLGPESVRKKSEKYMSYFDKYVMVDWSASSSPSPKRPVKDAIYIAQGVEDSINTHYCRTRFRAYTLLKETIEDSLKHENRLLCGFDFAFGYPTGFCEKITNKPDIFAFWDWLSDEIKDDDTNKNNRFEVASKLNSYFEGIGPFWGCPQSVNIENLPHKGNDRFGADRPDERRLIDKRLPHSLPVWQLAYNGAGWVAIAFRDSNAQ